MAASELHDDCGRKRTCSCGVKLDAQLRRRENKPFFVKGGQARDEGWLGRCMRASRVSSVAGRWAACNAGSRHAAASRWRKKQQRHRVLESSFEHYSCDTSRTDTCDESIRTPATTVTTVTSGFRNDETEFRSNECARIRGSTHSHSCGVRGNRRAWRHPEGSSTFQRAHTAAPHYAWRQVACSFYLLLSLPRRAASWSCTMGASFAVRRAVV